MSVAELIAKLQEMPQDLPVYRDDKSSQAIGISDVEAKIVEGEDGRGPLAERIAPQMIQAVVIS